jgi:hypothetical protein
MSRKGQFQNYSKDFLIDHILFLESILDFNAQKFYDRIKHGDEAHKEWLAKEFEDHFGTKIAREEKLSSEG